MNHIHEVSRQGPEGNWVEIYDDLQMFLPVEKQEDQRYRHHKSSLHFSTLPQVLGCHEDEDLF